MTADTAVASGRAVAEAQMVDACTITWPSTTPVVDPVTGVVTYSGATLYTGKCKVQMMQGTRGDALLIAGERAIAVQSAIVSVPTSVIGLRVGCLVTITTSQLDGDLPARVYRVEDIVHKSFLTARRLICQEVTG